MHVLSKPSGRGRDEFPSGLEYCAKRGRAAGVEERMVAYESADFLCEHLKSTCTEKTAAGK
ncbi:hypothetical protein TRAPUB_1383 [Trametes pubescens]|uniref:Uncharacterized protein n=1 Tax=Trametes pubescens TaxID=154538 RepID=A0A1M2VJD7_TRAPU|nr:hypothetical protein TRAPUB_1383 [Trametes pubescens]